PTSLVLLLPHRHSFPTRRSSDLSKTAQIILQCPEEGQRLERLSQAHFVGQNATESVFSQKTQPRHALLLVRAQHPFELSHRRALDRKSTRLNSSHQIISYAVFCL